jgi:hypothetical protein
VNASVNPVQQPKLRLAWLWWALGALLILATVNESLQRDVWDVAEIMPNDKFTHFSGYGGLAFWFAGLARRSRYVVVGAFLIALGGGLEIAQGAMDQGRTADWWDMGANAAGIIVGLGICALGLGNWMVWIERLLRLQK